MKSFILYIFLSCSTILFAQKSISTVLQQQDSLLVDRFVAMDNFGASYVIKDNILIKQKDTKKWQYNNFQLGEITSVDILNPLKITLFYEDFNTVIILDNTLNEIRRIDFNVIGEFKNLAAATTANDRNLWIFDTNTQQLEVYNYLQEKTPVQNLPISEKVITIKSNYNFCRVLSETTLYTYNIYGSLLSQQELTGVTDFSMTNTEVIFLKEKQLYYTNNDDVYLINLPTDKIAIKQFSLHDDILYIYDEIVLYQFQLKKPTKE
jgi:WD40 repeat protein